MIGRSARRFARTVSALAVAASAFSGAGCLQKETRSVIYLEPGGSLTWSILEADVRSDAGKPADRAAEEGEYRRDAFADPTPLMRWLEALGGRSITRVVLKDTPPFEVRTGASFDRIDSLFDRLCTAMKTVCTTSLTTDRNATTLTVEVLADTESPDEGPAGALDAVASLRIVITDGRFVAATGFKISDDGRVATLDDEEGDVEHTLLTLTWDKGQS